MSDELTDHQRVEFLRRAIGDLAGVWDVNAGEFIAAYARSAQRISPDLPEEIQPPAFPVDLDTIPWVQLPPQGAIVYIAGTGWVHFKAAP